MDLARNRLLVCAITAILLPCGVIGCRERPKAGEFVLDRYQGKGYLLLSFPSTSNPVYKKYKSDPARVRRVLLQEMEIPAVIFVVGGESGEVFDGPLLDHESVKYLMKTYNLDRAVVTQLIVSKDGRETERTTLDETHSGLLSQ